MGKKLAGLLGAAAALTTMTAAQAAPARGPEFPQATGGFAISALRASNAQRGGALALHEIYLLSFGSR